MRTLTDVSVPADERVMVGVASVPERVSSLERVVAALAPQADRVAVSLNGYTTAPAFLAGYPNVEATVRTVNGGDAEKFAAVDDWEGYVLTCDDDIGYPADYVETVVAGIDRYLCGAIVSFHGGVTAGWNGSHVAASHRRIACLGDLGRDDRTVNVLGTGCLGWHAGTVPVWRDVFRVPNMADVWLASHAHALGIPMVALAHEQGWITDICPPGPSIYESNRDGDGSPRDTRVARERELRRADWATRQNGRPMVRVSVATCGRPEKLAELVDDLEREAQWCDLEVGIYHDPKIRADYSRVNARVAANGWSWKTFNRPLGKRNHWRLVDRELADCEASRADWFVFLPDDVRLVRHALPRAISTWTRLDDPATLTLWRLQSLEGRVNWTGRRPEQREDATEIFHVDGCYLARRPTLETLRFACEPLRARPEGLGSGVGSSMSRRLHRQGARMYRVDGSLAVPNDDGVSLMNPEQRKLYPAVAL